MLKCFYEFFLAYGRGDKNDSISSLRRPTIVKRDIKIDPETEQKNIKEILGDYDDDCDDVPIISDYYTPVGLNEIKKEFPTVKVEDNSKHGPLTYPEDLNEFFGRPQPQLFMLQVMFRFEFIFINGNGFCVNRFTFHFTNSYQIHCRAKDQMKSLPIQHQRI